MAARTMVAELQRASVQPAKIVSKASGLADSHFPGKNPDAAVCDEPIHLVGELLQMRVYEESIVRQALSKGWVLQRVKCAVALWFGGFHVIEPPWKIVVGGWNRGSSEDGASSPSLQPPV